jgi:hypothetical protein
MFGWIDEAVWDGASDRHAIRTVKFRLSPPVTLHDHNKPKWRRNQAPHRSRIVIWPIPGKGGEMAIIKHECC